MGLAVLIAGLVVMLGSHVFVTFRVARTDLIARVGIGGYRVLFSLVSLAGLVLIVWGYGTYRANEWVELWSPPAFMRHVTIGLMLIASILVVATFIPSRIKARAKYPMLAAIKIWAFAHLLSNGDLGSVLLFGSFLGWAVYARIAARRRADTVPAAAPSGSINDAIVVFVGVVVFLSLGYVFHPLAIGIPVFGR